MVSSIALSSATRSMSLQRGLAEIKKTPTHVLVMHDTDTAHHLIHTDLAPRFQLLTTLFPILDDLADLVDDALADATNSLKTRHLIPNSWFTRLQVCVNGFQLRRLGREVGQEHRQACSELRREERVKM